MLNLQVALPKEEAARLDKARQHVEKAQRKARIFNLRQRLIGIDRDALKEQIEEKKKREEEEKKIEEAYVQKQARDAEIAKRLENQIELQLKNNNAKQREQQKAWLEQQMLKRCYADAERAHLEAVRATYRLGLTMYELGRLSRRQFEQATSKALAAEQETRKRMEDMREMEDREAEIYNVITSDLLTENPNLRQSGLGPNRINGSCYKGMTDAEREKIRRCNVHIVEQNKLRQEEEAQREKDRIKVTEGIAMTVSLKDREINRKQRFEGEDAAATEARRAKQREQQKAWPEQQKLERWHKAVRARDRLALAMGKLDWLEQQMLDADADAERAHQGAIRATDRPALAMDEVDRLSLAVQTGHVQVQPGAGGGAGDKEENGGYEGDGRQRGGDIQRDHERPVDGEPELAPERAGPEPHQRLLLQGDDGRREGGDTPMQRAHHRAKQVASRGGGPEGKGLDKSDRGNRQDRLAQGQGDQQKAELRQEEEAQRVKDYIKVLEGITKTFSLKDREINRKERDIEADVKEQNRILDCEQKKKLEFLDNVVCTNLPTASYHESRLFEQFNTE